MVQNSSAPRSLAEMLETYVTGRGRTDFPVSVANALKEIQERFPNAEHTDRELVDLVAAVGVSRNCNVAFDWPEGNGFQVPEVRWYRPGGNQP